MLPVFLLKFGHVKVSNKSDKLKFRELLIKLIESALKRAKEPAKDLMFIVTALNQITFLYQMHYQNEVHFKYINQEYEGLGAFSEVKTLYLNFKAVETSSD